MKTSTTLKTLRSVGDIWVNIEDLGSRFCLSNPAAEILDIHVVINDLAWRICNNMVSIEGSFFENIIYKGTDGTVYHQPETIPFVTSIQVPGLAPVLRLPHKVIVPVQNPQGTIDIQVFITELCTCFDLIPPFTVRQDILAKALLKISQIEQLEVFLNGVDGIFRFNNPVVRND